MEALFQFLKRFEKYSKHTDLVVAFGLVMVLAVMVIPMPALLLDLLLTASIGISLIILLVSIYTVKPLDFSVFPTILLVTTLYRLGLNVASTRLILRDGHMGSQAAGYVIETFGSVIVGDSYVIGLVVFVILVIINFVVITKGSGRVAEVAARFTLDAMPGKQMSIDADLNAGVITEEQARKRRKEIEGEADFYGSMDGASKFVRGDAIAGIIITIVNVIGGLLIGVMQKGLDIATAAKYYTMLSIGDGLVAQIPALVISTAAGIIVTKSTGNGEENMGVQIVRQLTASYRALAVVGAILLAAGILSDLPFLPFASMGAIIGGLAWFMYTYDVNEKAQALKIEQENAAKPDKEKIETLLPLDMLELEVGYGLIKVVESERSGDLLERIVSIRKQFALDLGIIVPSVHIRDNLQLEPGEYQILIKGNKVTGGTLMPDYFMAMDPGNTSRKIRGITTKEPAFGLDALWITENQKDDAELAGYTVVDLPTVIATHLTEILRTHAHELLGRQEAHSLIENFKQAYPKVVDELIPEHLSFGAVVQVLQHLLKEQVSIRDLRSVFETLADVAPRTKDVDILVEAVRRSMARNICAKLSGGQSELQVLSLSPHLEEIVANSLLHSEQGVQLVMDPKMASGLISEIARSIEDHPEIAAQPILLTSPNIRRHIRKLTERFIPQLHVLSHSEVAMETKITSVGIVEVAHAG